MTKTQTRTAPTKTVLLKSIIAMLCALLGSTAMSAERQRSAEPVTFANKSMSLTIAPDGKVSLKRAGKLVSEPGSLGWSIYNWTSGKSENNGDEVPQCLDDGIRNRLLVFRNDDGKDREARRQFLQLSQE